MANTREGRQEQDEGQEWGPRQGGPDEEEE